METKIKDKVIIAIYVAIGQLSPQETESYLKRVKDIMPTDDSVLYCFLPIIEGNSKIECVYPTFVANDDIIDKTNIVLDRILEKLNKDEQQD